MKSIYLIQGYIAILLCKLILVRHAFLLCELMLLNFDACSIREHNHQMATNIFLLSTNLGWTMGRQLLPQTEKASKYFCVCFLPLTACWRRQCVKFTCFFCAVVSYCVELCLSSFRLFSLIPMSILRRCYLNNWVGYTGTWFSFLGHFLLHCRANSSIVDNCWIPMLLCVSSYIFITSNIFFGSPGSVLRRMKMNLIQIC